MFLYRNPVDTIDSFSALFFKDAVANFFRWIHLDTWFIYNVLPFGEFMPFLAPLTTAEASSYTADKYKPLGILGFNAICYLSNMDAALKLVNMQDTSSQQPPLFAAVVRYESLVAHRSSVVSRILEKCGMGANKHNDADADADAAATAKIFDEDAHAGSSTASARRSSKKDGPVFMQAADIEALGVLLATHTELTALDYILPHTETNF